jgi:hypothetical protein
MEISRIVHPAILVSPKEIRGLTKPGGSLEPLKKYFPFKAQISDNN